MVDYDQATFYGEIKWKNPDLPNIYRQIKSTDLTEDDIFGYKKEIKIEQQRPIRCALKYTTQEYPAGWRNKIHIPCSVLKNHSCEKVIFLTFAIILFFHDYLAKI